ncbi:MAG: ribonuclease P protein component [Actinomycetota bacterium]|nr:ribonuclease P protein component [Actinomycetota bacterium]
MRIESLSRRSDFDILRSRGVRYRNSGLQIVYCDHVGNSVMLATAVSKKSGSAVIRNKFRRRVREAFRTYPGDMSPGIYLVSSNSDSVTVKLSVITRVLSEQQMFLKSKSVVTE